MLLYVTYDPNTGVLTGAYMQEMQPDHADCHIIVSAEQHANWTSYQANEARDGLELRPAPEPNEVPPPMPDEVTRRQGLEALFRMHGLKDTDIEAAIVEHVTDPDEQYLALNEFRTSQVFKRERPLVTFMGQVLLLDLPALFIFAKTL